MSDLTNSGVIWNEGEKRNSRVIKPPEDNDGHHGCHHQTHNEEGERIWIHPRDKRFNIEDRGDQYDYGAGTAKLRYRRAKSVQGDTRGFNWKDKALGVTSVIGYPDRPIPNLRCPDCHCQAVETDQIGVALCSGTPGWYFYYRQRSQGIGTPETKLELVNGEMKEVVKDKSVFIERQPTGEFREINPDKEEKNEKTKSRL